MNLKYPILIFGIIFALVNTCHAMNYKWSSTIPVEFVPLSNIDNSKQLDYYLNKQNIVVFYMDEKYSMQISDNTLYKFNTTRITPRKIQAVLYDSSSNIRNKVIVYNFSTKPIDAEKGIYEIKPKKILITHPINPDDKQIMDFIGWYVSENNGTFVYIDKVPPYYKHALINGIVIQNAIPDENGDYAIDVAGRKIKVDLRDEDLINKKIKFIKGLSEILNINTTYITTGSENLKVIKKENPDRDELDTLLNDYWFKEWYNGEYFHIYYNPSNIRNNYNVKNFDILAMSYYPMIYADKAPETFVNDPKGDYYPETITYKGTPNEGYWEKGVDSKNEYYHYDSGEPYWTDNDKYTSNWYYGGKGVLPNDEIKMNDKYKYFNHWFVKNYGYALSDGVNGLLLTSSDKYLVDAVFGKDNENISWKLAINNDNVDYIVIPNHKNVFKENNITVISIPGLTNDETYGVHYIDEYYLPPKDEEFGVYVADIIKYDRNKIYDLKDNYTWICSFKNYADWADSYLTNSVRIINNSIIVKSNKNIKITVYKKDINPLSLSQISTEEYNKDLNKIVIDNPPNNLILN